MSSRQGQAVFLKDVLEQARQRVKHIIESRPSQLENKDQITRQVSIGAVGIQRSPTGLCEGCGF